MMVDILSVVPAPQNTFAYFETGQKDDQGHDVYDKKPVMCVAHVKVRERVNRVDRVWTEVRAMCAVPGSSIMEYASEIGPLSYIDTE